MQIFELEKTTSTNDFLLSVPYQNSPQLCISKIQTSGRGQFGRVWQTQKKSALFSLRIKLPVFDISGLSLVVGISCIQVLKKYYAVQDLTIKWPNDIFLNGRKLGGILIENQLIDNYQLLTIGIGINVLSDGFASLNQNINIKQLAIRISEKVINNIEILQQNGFGVFSKTWQDYDFLTHTQKQIIFKNSIGFAGSVDDSGALVWQNGTKQVKIHSSNQIQIQL